MHCIIISNILRFWSLISLLGKCDNSLNDSTGFDLLVNNNNKLNKRLFATSDTQLLSANNSMNFNNQFSPDLSLYLITWNIKSELPKCDLTQLLDIQTRVDGQEDTAGVSPLADIYVIGLQEVPLRPANILFTDPWVESFDTIFKQIDYIRLKHIRLVGILLLVYTRRDNLPKFRSIETQYTRTGLGGFWGNKGGVSVSIVIDGVSICLVNSHLAAHYEQLDQRISDYNSIIDDQYFVKTRNPNILSHDYVIWIGDLNFRVDELTGDQIHDIILNAAQNPNNNNINKYQEIIDRDQLNRVRREGRAFSEFTETVPTFAPTYKFYVNTDSYDFKSRKPAYTDRILYRFTPNAYKNLDLNMTQIVYKSHPQYKQSDHKPVSALFHLITNKSLKKRQKLFSKREALSVDSDQTVSGGADELDSSDNQIYVTFHPITNWRVNNDSTAWYTITPNGNESIAQLSQWDWIGLYKSDFLSIDEHLAYVWANPEPSRWSPPPPPPQDESVVDSSTNDDTDNEVSGQTVTTTDATPPEPWFSVQFLDQSLLISDQFRLVYVTQDGDVLGISEPFFVTN